MLTNVNRNHGKVPLMPISQFEQSSVPLSVGWALLPFRLWKWLSCYNLRVHYNAK